MMKAWLYAVAAMVAISPASAERFAFGSLDLDRGVMTAIDLDSLHMVGGKWRAWSLVVLAKPDDTKTRSVRNLQEFDCAERRMHHLSSLIYGPAGDLRSNQGASEWSYPAPDTAEYIIFEYGCGIKKAEESKVAKVTTGEMTDRFVTTYKAKQASR